MVDGESSVKEYVKFVLVLGVILLLAFLLNNRGNWLEFMRWFMGVFFVVFASFKFVGYKMFAMMFGGYDVIAKRFKTYAYVYPFIELTLGILYIANITPTARDIFTVLVMGISAIGITQEIKKRSGIHCACLGNVIKLPLSTVSLVEDIGMGLMALLMLAFR